MKKITLILLVITTFLVVKLKAQTIGTFTDSRDDKIYKTVTIGTQTWMAENLNFTTSSGSWCYNDSAKYCKKLGRLYDWKTSKSACPSGWHLPSDNEWQTLINFLGGDTVAGGKLKFTSSWWNLWINPKQGTNSSGFSALPGGYYYNDIGKFYSISLGGAWWSATEYNSGNALGRGMTGNNNGVVRFKDIEGHGLSVRCLWD